MAKIALFDSNSLKFSREMLEHWQAQGHDARYEYGYNPWLANESDVVFIDVCDNNATVCSTGGGIEGEGASWQIPAGRKVVIRAIDIEIWGGHHLAVDWTRVSDVIFVAKHIENYARKDIDFESFGVKVHHIPCGVDTHKFTFREHPERNHHIAFVAELWSAKGVDMMLQIAKTLGPDYNIHALGRLALEPWYKAWVDYFIGQHNLNVVFTDQVPDMNAWLEDKAFALTCSKKEAFSYAIAEGMAKGLKPIIFDFLGARDIWPQEFIYTTPLEAASQIVYGAYDPEQYRQFVQYKYSLPLMLDRIDRVCGLT